jgi:hypothetical protein
MQIYAKQIIILFFLLLMLIALRGYVVAQQQKSRLVSANGEGTLKVGREEFRVHTVVAKLLEDGTAEITLVSDITVFVSTTWSRRDDTSQEIDLTITGGASKGGLEGNGKLFLSADRKSLASLKMQAVNKATKKDIEVSFVAK